MKRNGIVIDEKTSAWVGETARQQKSGVNSDVGTVGSGTRTTLRRETSSAETRAHWTWSKSGRVKEGKTGEEKDEY